MYYWRFTTYIIIGGFLLIWPTIAQFPTAAARAMKSYSLRYYHTQV